MRKSNKILKLIMLGVISFIPLNALALTKNESVYTTLNMDGTVSKMTITNHLFINDEKVVEDQSELSEILNINGKETFTNDNGSLKWTCNGKDIFYQGNTDKNLPIDINIKYYLNDKEKNAKDMIGKKGDIKIVITFKNNLKNDVNINGKKEELYTPFVIMSGMLLDGKSNNHIEVTNGKVVSAGSRSAIVSIASPGLYESLNVNELNNMNEVVIKYKTTKFSSNNIYIMATPKLIEEEDLDIFDDVDNITNSINTLQTSINTIEDGAKELSNGINQIYAGSEKIRTSMPTEDENKENEKTLNQLKNTNNSTVNTLLMTNSSLQSQKQEVQNKITEAQSKKAYVEVQINKADESLTSATNAYNEYSTKLSSANAGISQVQSQINSASDETIKNQLTIKLSELQGQKQSLEMVLPLLENQKNAISTAKEALNGTLVSINGTIELLNQTNNSLDISINANKNLAALISGNNRVVDSSINTINSMRTLTSGITELSNGAKKLNDGSITLQNGITKFNNEGIHALGSYSSKVKGYSNKIEALTDLSKNYKGFTSNNSTNTIFINKVESVK